MKFVGYLHVLNLKKNVEKSIISSYLWIYNITKNEEMNASLSAAKNYPASSAS